MSQKTMKWFYVIGEHFVAACPEYKMVAEATDKTELMSIIDEIQTDWSQRHAGGVKIVADVSEVSPHRFDELTRAPNSGLESNSR